jgi:hypothetical protein
LLSGAPAIGETFAIAALGEADGEGEAGAVAEAEGAVLAAGLAVGSVAGLGAGALVPEQAASTPTVITSAANRLDPMPPLPSARQWSAVRRYFPLPSGRSQSGRPVGLPTGVVR